MVSSLFWVVEYCKGGAPIGGRASEDEWGMIGRTQDRGFAGTGQRADSVHLVEKLCSFYHLNIQKHSSERVGVGDRGGSAVGAR